MALATPASWIIVSLIVGTVGLALRGSISPFQQEQFQRLRWVLIPYLALILGYVSPRLMGLSNPDWEITIGVGLALGFGLLALTAIIRVTNNRSGTINQQHQGDLEIQRQPLSTVKRTPTSPSAAGYLPWVVLNACLIEFHWSFLRGALWEGLLLYSATVEYPLYTAVIIAAGIATLEILIGSKNQEQRLILLITLLFTSVLFLSVRSYYLGCVLHIGMSLVLRSVSPNRSAIAPSIHQR